MENKEQYKLARLLLQTACKTFDIKKKEIISHNKSEKLNIVRGVIYYISRDYLIHPLIMGNVMHRSRGNVITMCERFRKYCSFRNYGIQQIDDILRNAYKEELQKRNIKHK